MGSFVAAVSGFVWGSLLTGIASLIYFSSARKPRVDEFTLALQKSNSLRGARLQDSEQVNFLTDLVSRLWFYLNPAIGETIVAAVEPMFIDLLPGPLSSLHFTKCDLGAVPMIFDNIIVHPLKNGTIHFDIDVIWDGACDIRLKAGLGVNLGVKNIKLLGRMQFVMRPLANVLPCIGAIQYSFINPPSLVLDFTGLGNVADVGGVDQTIRGIIKDAIAGVMVLPNRMAYKMDLACDYRDAFVPPVGIVRVTAVGGRGFEIEKRLGFKDDVPDVYLNVKLGTKTWKTSVQKNKLTPAWSETGDFLLSDNDQFLKVDAWDEDKGKFDADDFLGTAELTIGDMLLAGKTMEVELLDENNISTGAFVTLHCEICQLKADPKSYSVPPPNNHLGGLLTIIVTNAFGLPITKEEAESFVKIKYGKQEFFTGIVVDYPGYDCLNPIYDVCFLVPITRELVEGGLPEVTFELLNKWAKPEMLGSLSVSHKSLLEAPENVIKEKRAIGTGGASLDFQVSLQGVGDAAVFDASFASLGASARSLGGEASEGAEGDLRDEVKQVKVTIVSGKGFKIKKKKLRKDDVPDVYCNVKFGSSPSVWRTSTIKDSVAPEWKESQVYSLTSETQVISLDALDANSKGDDTPLGGFRVAVGKVLLNGGTMEVELQNVGSGKEAFIIVACELVTEKKTQ
jgi:hypothetical protein